MQMVFFKCEIALNAVRVSAHIYAVDEYFVISVIPQRSP